MADIKITDLAAYTDPVSTDVLPIVDVGSDLTKKVSIADLLENAGTGSAAAPSFSFDGDNDTGIYQPGANQLAITTAGTGRLFIDASGNVEIRENSNTVSTGASLYLYDTAGAASSSNSSGRIAFYSSDNTDGASIRAEIANLYENSSADSALTFKTYNGSLSERLRIDSSGNVGIGTTSPGVNLDIVSSSVNSTAKLRSLSSTLGGQLQVSGTDLILRNRDNANLAFWTNDTERMRIDSSGRLGINTTNPTKLLVVASVVGDGIMIGANATGLITRETEGLRITGGSTNKNISFVTAGSERMRIDTAGKLLFGTSSTTQPYSQLIQGVSGLTSNANLALTRFNASPTVGSGLGIISFADSGHVAAATIAARRDSGTWTSGTSQPTYLEFSTTADGASTPTERLRIDSSGTAIFAADATINSLTIGRGGGNIANNTAAGYQALLFNTTGANNTATGYVALQSNTTGNNNTANGSQALRNNTTGVHNVANGYQALYFNTTGSNNTANGRQALYFNTNGNYNAANGRQALYSNTTGSNNTANGYQALRNNTTGNDNVANGLDALYNNTTGSENVANGVDALRSNTTAGANVANGVDALRSNTTGSANTANGYLALYYNTTGINNTANGRQALYFNTTGSNNTANGRQALNNNTTGSGNIGIGFKNNLGTYAPVFNPTTENNRLVLGHTAITNAYVQVAWTVTSDARDKMNFAPVPYGLDFVNQLKPTAYQFKVDRDTETPNGDVRYGFKAQDILALEGDNPVIIDTEDPDNLKYKGEHLVPVLVNAVQELTAMVKELKSELAALKGA